MNLLFFCRFLRHVQILALFDILRVPVLIPDCILCPFPSYFFSFLFEHIRLPDVSILSLDENVSSAAAEGG
jgi:hypothetical protein